MRGRDFRPTFEGGVLPPGVQMQAEVDARRKGFRSAQNIMLRGDGGFRRRWGGLYLCPLSGEAYLDVVGTGPGDVQILAFSNGAVSFYSEAPALIQTVSSAPWTTAQLPSLKIAADRNKVVICGPFKTQVLSRVGGLWSLSPIAFSDGLTGRKSTPFYRFEPTGVAIQPSGYSGSVTVTATGGTPFKSTHVGTRIRYIDVEMLVTAFTSSTNVTATVVGPSQVYPTLNLTVGSSAGFFIGQEVEGSESKIRSVVSGVGSGTVQVILLSGFEQYTTADKLIGPTQKTTISGIALEATPAATTQWDEELMSDARGWPTCCGFHRQRLVLGGFPEAPSLLAASTIGDPFDFDVGQAQADDAVVELVGRDATAAVLDVATGEQLLVFTEAGAHYVPETTGLPFGPLNAEFLRIGPEVIGTSRPLPVTEGVMFSEAISGRLLMCVPTGNVRRSWEVADVSENGSHLLERSPTREIELWQTDSDMDRIVVASLADGTMAAMSYRRGQEMTGWVPWSTDGEWRSVVALNGRLIVAVKRVVDSVAVWQLESMQSGYLADGCITATTSAYANRLLEWSNGRQTLGLVSASGAGAAPSSVTGWTHAGYPFAVSATPTETISSELGHNERCRIYRVSIEHEGSGAHRVSGESVEPHFASDDEAAPPPLIGENERTSTRQTWLLGTSRRPTYTITQNVMAPLEVLAITAEWKSS